MSSSFGKKIVLTVFGDSHGEAIGCTIDGLPAGHLIDLSFIKKRLDERKRGFSKGQKPDDDGSYTTKRNEPDEFKILSGLSPAHEDDPEGVENHIVSGSPLMAIIENRDVKREDYKFTEEFFRPGHSDYPAFVKSKGHGDLSGGGHFSGRLTAPIVFAGSVAESILRKKGIQIELKVSKPDIKENDSYGAKIDIVVDGMPVGIGSPIFGALDAEIAKAIYSIPGVKAVGFGQGFNFCNSKGSDVVDTYVFKGNKIDIKQNHNGGIVGGLSNGAKLLISVAVKPVSSLKKSVTTLNFATMEQDELCVGGRHDSFIGERAATAIRSILAFTLLDEILFSNPYFISPKHIPKPRRYALIGEVVKTLCSKNIHEYIMNNYPHIFAPGSYDILRMSVFEIPKGYDGFNITMPYKLLAANRCILMGSAAATGVVNTIDIDGNGYNTDTMGFEELLPENIKDFNEAYILGSGATAKTVRNVLNSIGVETINIVSRSKERGMTYDDMRRNILDPTASCKASNSETIKRILINTSPVSMDNFGGYKYLGVDDALLKKFDYAIDVNYHSNSPLLSIAKNVGVPAVGGMLMLIVQAIEAQLIWNDAKISKRMKRVIAQKILDEVDLSTG